MKKVIPVLIITVLVFSLMALSKTPPPQPNWTPNHCEMDNGTLAHGLANYMLEFEYALYPCCLWRPYDTTTSQLYMGDLWVCITGGINKAVFDSGSQYGWVPFGIWSNHISQSGDATWPSEIPIMSDHDTYFGANDQGYIGLEAYRHSLMWNNPADADYFIHIYTIKNTSGSTLNNLYVSRFCDFDITRPGGGSYMDNICGSDFATQTVWMKERQTDCNCWVGLRRLNGNLSSVNHWDIYSDPDESEIIDRMVNGFWFPESTPFDWRILASFGPFSLAPGASLDFSIVHAFGSSYADMMANLNRAKYRYDGSATTVEPSSLGRIKGLYH